MQDDASASVLWIIETFPNLVIIAQNVKLFKKGHITPLPDQEAKL